MAPASVPAARTFSPPFSRTIARIIPGKLVERSFSSVCVYFILSFFFICFLSAVNRGSSSNEREGRREGGEKVAIFSNRVGEKYSFVISRFFLTLSPILENVHCAQ